MSRIKIASDLTCGYITRLNLSKDMYEAADETLAFFNTVFINLGKDPPFSEEATRITSTILSKEEVEVSETFVHQLHEYIFNELKDLP